MKRILVIGNGFDLAHALPTSYGHFLAFCSAIIENEFDQRKTDEIKDIISNFYSKYKDNDQYIQDFKYKIKSNKWVIYFLKRYQTLKKGWIDFEKEIERACLDSLQRTIDLNFAPLCDPYKRRYDIATIKNDFSSLLQLIIEFFELVNNSQLKLFSRDVVDFLPHNTINFNYTSTLEKIYHFRNVDHIHGNVQEKNIILGFNTTGEDKNDQHYVEFLKYAQKSMNDIRPPRYEQYNTDEDIIAMFFGHSLNSTDGETIKKIIDMSRRVTVLFHNEDAKKEYISNLIGIFGRKKYDNIVNSSNKKIYFNKIKPLLELNNEQTFPSIIDFLNKNFQPTDEVKVLDFYEKVVFKNDDTKEYMLNELANKCMDLWSQFKWDKDKCVYICTKIIEKLKTLLEKGGCLSSKRTILIMIDDIKYNLRQV